MVKVICYINPECSRGFVDFNSTKENHSFHIDVSLTFCLSLEVEVQYYVHGMSYGAENGFLKKLRSCLEKQSVDLKFTKDLSTRGSIPVLLFCVNATHVAIEAIKALAQIGGKKVNFSSFIPSN